MSLFIKGQTISFRYEHQTPKLQDLNIERAIPRIFQSNTIVYHLKLMEFQLLNIQNQIYTLHYVKLAIFRSRNMHKNTLI